MPNEFEYNNYPNNDNYPNNNGFEPNQPSPPPPLGKNQKIAAAVLAGFAIFILIAWAVQLKKSISGPFAVKSGSQSQTINSGNSAEELKAKDTDKDGLSDWDELNVYHTSPYLEDSDSDGFIDKQEVDSGKDPNCPTGRDCYSLGIVDGDKSVVSQGEAEQDNSTLNGLVDQLGASQPGQTGTSSFNASQVESLMGRSMDAATLRQLLLQAGMDKTVLDKINDEELMKSYQEVAK